MFVPAFGPAISGHVGGRFPQVGAKDDHAGVIHESIGLRGHTPQTRGPQGDP